MQSTNPYQVVIDDFDPRVVYMGAGWFVHNPDSADIDGLGGFSGTTYLHTLHGTNASGSLSFSFQGTRVRLTGTNNQKKISGVVDPQWECFVDNIRVGTTGPVVDLIRNNWVLCEAQNLRDGPHEITLNVTSAGQTFWFDKIQYLPSPSVTFDNVTLLVDNHNPGVVFDSKWQSTSGGVANMTQTYGSTATFNFTGTRVDWLGIIPDSSPPSSATYSIDGGPAVLFNLQGKAGMSSQTFFSVLGLPAGPHNLLVTYLGNSQQIPLTFDYMYLSNVSFAAGTNTDASSTPGPAISGSAPSSAISSSTPGPTISGSTPGPAISGTNSPDVPQSPTRGRPVGAIAGSVVGGTALLILFSILLWWYRRRRAHTQGDAGLGDTGTTTWYHESGVTPYMYNTSSAPATAYVGVTQTNRQGFHKNRDLDFFRRVEDDAPPRYTQI